MHLTPPWPRTPQRPAFKKEKKPTRHTMSNSCHSLFVVHSSVFRLVSFIHHAQPREALEVQYRSTVPHGVRAKARESTVFILTMNVAPMGFPANQRLCRAWRAFDAPSISLNFTYTCPPVFFLRQHQPTAHKDGSSSPEEAQARDGSRPDQGARACQATQSQCEPRTPKS